MPTFNEQVQDYLLEAKQKFETTQLPSSTKEFFYAAWLAQKLARLEHYHNPRLWKNHEDLKNWISENSETFYQTLTDIKIKDFIEVLDNPIKLQEYILGQLYPEFEYTEDRALNGH